MSDEQPKKKIVSKLIPTSNFFKRIANFFGASFHYAPTPGTDIRELPVFKRIEQDINYTTVKELNRYGLRIEGQWDPVEGLHENNLGALRQRMLDVYSKDDSGEIKESLGPFTNVEQVTREGRMSQYGTPEDPKKTPPVYNKETITIKKDGVSVVGEFDIPKAISIIYEDGRGGKYPAGHPNAGKDNPVAYELAFFGHGNSEYWINLKNQIQVMCDNLERELVAKETDANIIDNIKENIRFNREVAKKRVDSIFQVVFEIESKHRSQLIGGGKKSGDEGLISHFDQIVAILKDMNKLRLTDEQVYYTHTFKVIKPILRDKNGNVVDEISRHGWAMAPGEFEAGYDKHGWPLEVGDGETKFDGRTLKIGEVLIDLYENRPVKRTVPKQFITDLDPMYVANMIYYYYDAFRDDLRDGRYHKKSVTVIDRIRTELGVRDQKLTIDAIKSGAQSTKRAFLNAMPDGSKPLRPSTDPKFYDTTLKPTDRLPSFDTRANFKTIHMGRRYYWESQNETVISDEPTLTTRGSAMYILHRVIEETKYWGGTSDPAKAGVVELMNAIGQATDGFDIGPNMGPGEKGWGKPFSKNPFDPNRM